MTIDKMIQTDQEVKSFFEEPRGQISKAMLELESKTKDLRIEDLPKTSIAKKSLVMTRSQKRKRSQFQIDHKSQVKTNSKLKSEKLLELNTRSANLQF